MKHYKISIAIKIIQMKLLVYLLELKANFVSGTRVSAKALFIPIMINAQISKKKKLT
jgi:hypothetical protein